MKIGVPKEIKNNESRVGLTPAGVYELTRNGHVVFVQTNAGIHSGYEDVEYEKVGALILSTIDDVYQAAEMIVKVKEPIEEEYDLIKENQIVFTYFHFASSDKLTQAMLDSKSICIAYETVECKKGKLPLLTPMSEVAGRMAIQQGARYLEAPPTMQRATSPTTSASSTSSTGVSTGKYHAEAQEVSVRLGYLHWLRARE